MNVIKDVGLAGPNHLIKEIVDQAEGRAGLAALLAHLCLIGDVQEVYKGEALEELMLKYLGRTGGMRIPYILAAFSVGGEAGMRLEDVADCIGMDAIQVREIVTELNTGGVLWEIGETYLSVHPKPLRHVLIRDVFFHGPASFPVEPLIDKSPDLEQTTLELIAAYWSGARIQKEWLIPILERVGSNETWAGFAWQGPEEANWVLKHHPQVVKHNPMAFLHYISQEALPIMFDAAIGDTRQLHSATDHPMRIVDDWIKSGKPGESTTINNRLTLIKSAKEWLLSGKDSAVGFQAVNIGFSPIFRNMITDPGAGHTVTLRSAYLLLSEMRVLRDQWLSFREILKPQPDFEICWPALRDLVHGWAYPELFEVRVSDNSREFMLSFSRQILTDMSSIAQGRTGYLQWINQFSIDRGFDLRFEVDPVFEIMYPLVRRDEFREHEEAGRKQIEVLATSWSQRDPQTIVEKIIWIEEEAKIAGLSWPYWTNYLLSEISLLVDSPKAWAETLIRLGCSAEMVTPFLVKTAEKQDPGWFELTHICLQNEALRGAAILSILKHRDPPSELVDEAMSLISGFSGVVKTMCLRKEIHEDQIIKRLLTHQDEEISSAAAQGIWFSPPKHVVPDAVMPEWCQAVIRSRETYFISDVMTFHPELAYDWLSGYINEDKDEYFQYDRAIHATASVLDAGSRRNLLKIIPAKYHFSEAVYSIIGDDLNVYRALLDNERLKIFHLVPLNWSDREIWVDKARLALDAGYSPSEISLAVYGFPFFGFSWTGNESIERQKWVDKFDKLCSHPEKGIQAIGQAGKEDAEREKQNALEREKQEEIYGFRGYRTTIRH